MGTSAKVWPAVEAFTLKLPPHILRYRPVIVEVFALKLFRPNVIYTSYLTLRLPDKHFSWYAQKK